jgi:hypothetical protein
MIFLIFSSPFAVLSARDHFSAAGNGLFQDAYPVAYVK